MDYAGWNRINNRRAVISKCLIQFIFPIVKMHFKKFINNLQITQLQVNETRNTQAL